MMSEGRVTQGTLFYGFSLAGVCTMPHALFERRYSVGTSYADIPLTSDGRTPNCARKRLLKWDELLNPIEYAISVIDCAAQRDEGSRS